MGQDEAVLKNGSSIVKTGMCVKPSAAAGLLIVFLTFLLAAASIIAVYFWETGAAFKKTFISVAALLISAAGSVKAVSGIMRCVNAARTGESRRDAKKRYIDSLDNKNHYKKYVAAVLLFSAALSLRFIFRDCLIFCRKRRF